MQEKFWTLCGTTSPPPRPAPSLCCSGPTAMAPWTRRSTKRNIPSGPSFPPAGSFTPRYMVLFGHNLAFKLCNEAVITRAQFRSPYHHGPLQLYLMEQLCKLLKGLSCKAKKRLVSGARTWHWSMGYLSLAAAPASPSKGLPKNREEVAPLGKN